MLAIIRIAQHAWNQLWSLRIFCKGGNTRGGGRVWGGAGTAPHPFVCVPYSQTLGWDQRWYASSLKAWSTIKLSQMTFWEALSVLGPVCDFWWILFTSFLSHKDIIRIHECWKYFKHLYKVLSCYLITFDILPIFLKMYVVNINIHLAYFMLFLPWRKNHNLLEICTSLKVAFQVLSPCTLLTSSKGGQWEVRMGCVTSAFWKVRLWWQLHNQLPVS